ncbi:MAG: helix-turn-helix transcriptional regulator [Bacteroidetes bacterium]|nr:helix-turn-helix transcriptional regulator [Bacteroidota bacterium]
MDKLEIDNILKLKELKSELEFERATSIYGKLRWMTKDDNSLEPIRQHLKSLITQYEENHWNDESGISDEQITESDIAEKIVSSENKFTQKRKDLIRRKLKEAGISQQDLAKILGHRPNYMSELINGVRPFSRDDIVVLYRLFEIEFKDLVPPFLKSEVTNHIKLTLRRLKNKKVKLKIKDLETV